MTPNPKPQDDGIDGPAKITPLHVLGRPATNDDGKEIFGKEAWTKNTILEAMFDKGKLGDKASLATLARRDAGRFYSKLFWLREPHGRDSTQALNAGRTGGGGLPLSIAQEAAGKACKAIEIHLGAKDKIILQAVCRDDMLPNQGVKLANCDVETRVFARFRDALDELAVAIQVAALVEPCVKEMARAA